MDTDVTPQTQTRAFLRLLDPRTQRFHFRTFDDKGGSSRPALIGNFNGTINQVEPKLISRNAAGAGVFVVVNEGGQRKADIKRIRAVFADTDGAPLEPIVNALSPHAVIESSPGKYHVYYLVADDFPLDMFTPIQEAISAKFGTDPSVKDLPRVMRLPGFKHNKDTPHDVQFVRVQQDLPHYSVEGIVTGLGLNIGQKVSTPMQASRVGTSHLSKALSTGAYTEPNIVHKGGRNAALVAHIGHLRGSGEYEDVVTDKVREFNTTRCNPPLDNEEVDGVLARYPDQVNVRPSDLASDEWPEPQTIKAALKPVPVFDLDLLPNAFKPLVADASELMQAPADFIAVPLMVAAAAVLGNRWAIAPKAHDLSWKVTPVLWGAVIGRPGTKKSPCIDKALAPLSKIETTLAANHAVKLSQYQAAQLIYEAQVAAAKKQAKTSQAVPPLPPKPEEPQPERLVVNDSTYQKLGDILQWSPRGVVVVMDELVGLLESLTAKGQEGARAFYLAAWNGNQTHRIDRVGRGSIVIDRLAVSVLGGMQPGISGCLARREPLLLTG